MGNAQCCAQQNEGSAVSVVTTSVNDLPKDPVAEPLPMASAADPVADPDGAEAVAPKATPPPTVAVPEGALVLTFKTQDSSKKPMTFTKKPLGIDFCKNIPVSVKRTHPGGVAQELGIQPGWVLVKVNDVDLHGRTLPEIQELLVKFAVQLPA
mmetsp:Transcript_31130/g.78783  ORF Transcript_31130/g.78783 Transcript_31130/m.78783 type:complete len:153 (+) Transcript_31130:120-578(+)